jgi:hypothetical protein
MAPPAQSKSHQWFLEHAGGRLLDLPEKREKREKKTKRKKKERKKEGKKKKKKERRGQNFNYSYYYPFLLPSFSSINARSMRGSNQFV